MRVSVDPEATVPDETVTDELAKETAPGLTVIVGIEEVTVLAPIVALTVVALPAVVPVKVAV